MQTISQHNVFMPNMLSLQSFTHQDVAGVTPGFFHNAVSITSESGVGSTTTMKGLMEKKNGFTRSVSGGGLMRLRAKSCGLTIEELAAAGATGDYSHDKWLDTQLAQFGVQNNTVMESRLAHLWMPMAFKVKLVCPLDVRAERRASQLSKPVHVVKREIEERDDNDNTRYGSLYPGCLWHYEVFDLVVSTAERTPPEAVGDIIKAHQRWFATKVERGLACFELFMPQSL